MIEAGKEKDYKVRNTLLKKMLMDVGVSVSVIKKYIRGL